MPRPVITLTTDFGTSDGYVGAMKGAILRICPEAALVDICHEIRPQAVRQAAYILSTAARYFADGTIHLAVVDPGVGSPRRAVAVQAGPSIYVCPDNGVLSLVLLREEPRQAVHLTNPAYRLPRLSATFHGRDLFAPAAAHLAAGVPLSALGEGVAPSTLVALPFASPDRQANLPWDGEVLHVDRFGNLITDLPACQPLATDLAVRVGGVEIGGLSRTYADVRPGELVVYVGSSGYLEVGVRDGSAAERLGIGVGGAVHVSIRERV